MASKLKVDQIEGQSGTSVEVPTGHTLKVTDHGNNKIITTNSSGVLTPLTIGSAGSALKVNSSANGYEFGTAGGLKATGFHDHSDSQQITASSFTELTNSAFNVSLTAGDKIHLFAKVHGYQNTNDKTDNISVFVTESGASEYNILNTATGSGGMGMTRTSYARYWIGGNDHGLSALDGFFTWTVQTTGTHSFAVKVYSNSGDIRATGSTVWYMVTSV